MAIDKQENLFWDSVLVYVMKIDKSYKTIALIFSLEKLCKQRTACSDNFNKIW